MKCQIYSLDNISQKYLQNIDLSAKNRTIYEWEVLLNCILLTFIYYLILSNTIIIYFYIGCIKGFFTMGDTIFEYDLHLISSLIIICE